MKQELEVKTRRSILRGRNSGQAVVEYILIVSIAVGLIVIMKGAFTGMNTFINNYLGLYTECLMAHGELPALGVSGSTSFSDGSGLKEHLTSGYKCESGFKPFTIADGRPPVGGSTSNQASQNSGGKSGSKSDNDSSNANDNASSKSSKDGGADKDKDAVGKGGGSGSSPYDEGQIKRSGRRGADGYASAGSNRSRLIEDDSEGDEAGGNGRKRRPRQSRIIYRDASRTRKLLGQDAEQLLNQSTRSTNKRKVTARAIAKADGGGSSGPRSGLVKPPPEKKFIIEETKESSWGFGKMLKWLLIIGIIVALVIFFGGQLMNYSNSDS